MTKAGRRSANTAREAAAREAAARDTATQSADAFAPREPELNVHEIRMELLRKLAKLSGEPQRCAIARCRRLRRCAGADTVCLDDTSHLRPVSKEEEQAAMAQLQTFLKRAMAAGPARQQRQFADKRAWKEHARQQRARQRNARAASPRGRV